MTHEMPLLLLRRRPWFISIFQAWLIVCSLVFAWLLRFDFTLPYRSVLLFAIPVLVLLRLVTMAYFGLLRGWWKYVGLRDGIDILKAVGTGSFLFFIIMRFILGATGFPRTVYILEALLTAGLLAGVRLLSRLLAESVRENICREVISLPMSAETTPEHVEITVGCIRDFFASRPMSLRTTAAR